MVAIYRKKEKFDDTLPRVQEIFDDTLPRVRMIAIATIRCCSATLCNKRGTLDNDFDDTLPRVHPLITESADGRYSYSDDTVPSTLGVLSIHMCDVPQFPHSYECVLIRTPRVLCNVSSNISFFLLST